MTDFTHHHHLSDAAIRQFLFGRLRQADQTAFERALFVDSQLEQRVRLAEIAVADDYALGRLSAHERTAFAERFLLTNSRRRQLEVSTALRARCAAESRSRPEFLTTARSLFTAGHPAWKWVFAMVILIVLFATIWLVTKEPRLVQRFVPRRVRPSAAATPTPEPAHHAVSSSESPAHREEPPASPSHEIAQPPIVLNSKATADEAPVVTVSQARDAVRLQLMLETQEHETYRAELLTLTGETLFVAEELRTQDGGDRVKFDIPVERLKVGDFQVKLTRASDATATTYYFRVR